MRLVIDQSEDDLLHIFLLRLYFVCLATVWFYSISRWKNLVVAVYQHYMADERHHQHKGYCYKEHDEQDDAEIYLTKKWKGDVAEVDENLNLVEEKKDESLSCQSLVQNPSLTSYPAVTVQICSYNEGAVIEETICRACSLDWPLDSLFVQVLDDSTEESSKMVVQQCIERLSHFRGCNVELLTRPNRQGYKAGNLAYHFPSIRTQFVLYLDGDHRVEPDLLRRTIPKFYDPKTGQRCTDVALVQVPWGYYNTHSNLLTECDAIGLDIHHTVEQTSRAHLYQMFGFNGTGGVWSTKAVSDAGGWTFDTVTEDLSISYLAFLKGYRFVYVKDCPQELELPQGILAHIQQKQRWTKGFFQVFRLYYWRVLRSNRASLSLKLEAFMHLTGPIQLVAAVVGILVYPYLVFHDIHTRMLEAMSIFPVIEPVCSALHAVLTKTASRRCSYVSDHIRFTRILWILPYFALRFGMAPFELKAILEGLLSNDATFHTTPKEGDSRKSLAAPAKVTSKLKLHWVDDAVATLALFIGLHQFAYIMIYDRHFERDGLFNWCVEILNVLICLGMAAVSLSSLMAKGQYFRWKLSSSSSCFSRRMCYIAIITLCFLNGTMVCFMHVIPSIVGFNIPDMVFNAPIVSSKNTSFLCLPSDEGKMGEKHPLRPMSPIVVFAQPRTGSNLFFDMFYQRKEISKDFELLDLYELFQFSKETEWYAKTKMYKFISRSCDIPNPTETATSTLETEIALKSSNSTMLQNIEQGFQTRHAQPQLLLEYLARIPTRTRLSYYIFKVFDDHIKESALGTPGNLVDIVRHEDENARFIVLWRRRIIETFVSYKIAMARNEWIDKAVNVQTDKIVVEKAELEDFVQETRNYYLNVKDSLNDRNQHLVVFEYDKDLRTLQDQEATVAQIESILGLDDGKPSRAKETLSRLSRKKQSDVDIKELITNWDEVVSWGYGGDVEEWEDLFA